MLAPTEILTALSLLCSMMLSDPHTPQQFETPRPPLAPHWSADVHVDIQVMLTHFILNGKIAVDATTNGMYATVYGDDPNNYWGKLNATVVAQPLSNGSIVVWDLNNGKCSNDGEYNASTVPKLGLPPSAKYQNQEMVDQTLCEVWLVPQPYHDVEYSKIFVGPVNSTQPLNIAAITALYSGGAANAYLNVRIFNHNVSRPNPDWFRRPVGCDSVTRGYHWKDSAPDKVLSSAT
jgi:hypothetical protein